MTTTAAPPTDVRGKPNTSMYPGGMAKRVLLGVQELRRVIGKLSASIEAGEHTVLTSRGKPFAVVVPIAWYRESAIKMKDPTEF